MTVSRAQGSPSRGRQHKQVAETSLFAVVFPPSPAYASCSTFPNSLRAAKNAEKDSGQASYFTGDISDSP